MNASRHGVGMANPPRSQVPDRIGEGEFIALMAMMMALQALCIDAMLPALGAIARDLDVADPNRRQLVVGVFLFAAGFGSLVPGALADRYGRRPVLMVSFVAYGLLALGCAVVTDFTTLLVLRAVQAIASAGLSVLPGAIIRDRFGGDRMARMMSTISVVFMLVPMIAPSYGQAVMLVAGWRWIFGGMAVMAVVIGLWAWLRLPETLNPEYRQPIAAGTIVRNMAQAATNRAAMGYVLGGALLSGALFGYINSAQQLIAEHFGAGARFPLLFALMAGSMAVANFSNARIVERFGARRVSHAALLGFIAVSTAQVLQAFSGHETLGGFILLMGLNLCLMGFIGANFGSIALQPFARTAGAASSFQAFTRMAMGALLGGMIGQAYDDSARPLALALLACGAAALALVLVSERGRLFRRLTPPGMARPLPEPELTEAAMTQTFDLAVIGGGVNGAGIARDAAGRGARVLLLEAGDLAQGTSSASTKLIHGGLRYLEHYEFALVREALSEREALWAIAPHLIRPLRFVLPHVRGLRPRWLLRAGLFLYDHIGGRKRLPATRTINLRRHPAGAPLKAGFGTGFEYSDGWVDDARLVVMNALDAAEHGATVLTRTPVTAARREVGGWSIDTPAGTFRARALVNAAGPAVLKVEGLLGDEPDYAMRLVRGSHIVVRKLFDHPYAYFFQLPDGRIFFAIPYERDFTLIGTTDADQREGDPIAASAEEIAYLCEGASRYFAKAVTPADVVWSYAGVRPLIDDGSGKPEAATRGYRLELSEPAEGAPLLSVYGGKITTYRHLAEEAADLLAARLPALSGGAWTKTRPLPGGDFAVDELPLLKADLALRHPDLPATELDRIARAYGTRAARWLGQPRGREFGAGLCQAEVDYLRAEEWAVSAEDVLWRRTKLGLRLDPAQQQALADYLGS